MKSVRERLIDATAKEVFTKGFNSASLANILNRAEVKKGAMYHYFPSKKAMVLTMIEEVLNNKIEEKWTCILNQDKDELDTIISLLTNKKEWDLVNGCPLGNLLQESLDEDQEFSELLTSVLSYWKSLINQSFLNAQNKNIVRNDINIQQCTTFIIASLEGAFLLSKKTQDTQDYDDCMAQLSIYINSLRNV